LIDELQAMVERGMAAMSAPAAPTAPEPAASAEPAPPPVAQGTLVPQTLERVLRPVVLDVGRVLELAPKTSLAA